MSQHSHRLTVHDRKKETLEAVIVFSIAGLIVAVVAALLFVVLPKSMRTMPDIQVPQPAPIHRTESAVQ